MIVIGDSNVSVTRYAFELDAGVRAELRAPDSKGGADMLDLKDIYFDGGTTNDDLNVAYLQRAGVR